MINSNLQIIRTEERFAQMISWIWIVVIVVMLVGIIMLAIGVIDGNRYVVREESFELPKLTESCRFVMISDLHGKVYGRDNEKVIADIRKAKPDFIVIVGDLITSKPKAGIEAGVRLVNELSKDYRVYYALGNHETKLKEKREQFGERYEELMEAIKHPNVTVLEDAFCELRELNVRITGLELERTYFARLKKKELPQDYLRKHVGVAKEDMCNILLAHNPDYFEEYAEWGADLVLSGHVHGGIMRLPVLGGVISPSLVLFPRYDGGVFGMKETTMLLVRGMGAHTIPLRFFNPAELYVVSLEKKADV